MRVLEEGQQKPSIPNDVSIMSNGIGTEIDMFALFEDGSFMGCIPRFPCAFGAAVTWGYSRSVPYGATCRPIVSGPLGAWLSGALPDMVKGLRNR